MSPLTVPKLLLCCRTRALLPFFSFCDDENARFAFCARSVTCRGGVDTLLPR